MKSFRQYLRQTLYESDPRKYDDVGKKIDNETSEVPVSQGGIPPSEIVDDQVWQTDEEIEKDEEQQAKKDEEQQAKRWVKRYNEKLMAQQQEREMQPPSAPRRGALAPVPPDDSWITDTIVPTESEWLARDKTASRAEVKQKIRSDRELQRAEELRFNREVEEIIRRARRAEPPPSEEYNSKPERGMGAPYDYEPETWDNSTERSG